MEMSARSPTSLLIAYLAVAGFVAAMPWYVTGVMAVAAGLGVAIVAWSPRAGDDRLRRMSAGLCAECGYDLTGASGRCPECGAHYGTGWSQPAEPWERGRPERRPVARVAAPVDEEFIPPT
jgi:hypothetical protein